MSGKGDGTQTKSQQQRGGVLKRGQRALISLYQNRESSASSGSIIKLQSVKEIVDNLSPKEGRKDVGDGHIEQQPTQEENKSSSLIGGQKINRQATVVEDIPLILCGCSRHRGKALQLHRALKLTVIVGFISREGNSLPLNVSRKDS
ncbi:hypothetical protein PABG_03478 [Paracoccidioides brasiliensis Pb03]|uniref:Uncharacterized protein n=1 Tax=Paracoccidioides brasiliensis TaxID=121759 RepID=A0A1D2JCX7_PARBR|nr:hypothetical protein PABG_03478 [Paracoccidioides brasiliensis Pb03]ODH26634.1 hypothetical protein ACO22_04511 [Paracoccidioides brasiliensis]ODH52941.1 hypothetical protein GX48_00809 [Paracoccidioides brasiliensis]